MVEINSELVRSHAVETSKINLQRKYWLILSSLVFLNGFLILFYWDYISNVQNNLTWWAIIAVSLTLTINWWILTAILIHKIIYHQFRMIGILSEIGEDLLFIRAELLDMYRKQR